MRSATYKMFSVCVCGGVYVMGWVDEWEVCVCVCEYSEK